MSIHRVLFIATIFLFCLRGRAEADVELRVAEDSVLHSFDKSSDVILKKDSPTTLKLTAPALVTSATRARAFLIPVYDAHSSLTLEPPLKSEVVEKVTEEQAGALLSKVLPEIADIQNLIRNHQVDRAAKQLEALQSRYPSIKFFDFLRASLAFLQGNKAEAERLTEQALKVYPNYEEGRAFLKNLKGRES